MTLDKSIAAMLLAPLLGLVIPGVIYFRKLPTPRLTPSEKELMTFSSQPVTVSTPGRLTVYSGLLCPLRPPLAIKSTAASGKSFPPGSIPTPGTAAIGQPGFPVATERAQRVSMIYSDGQARIAIIDGHVMREGSTTGSNKVVKIEKTRVLVRTDGKDIWLYID